MVEDLVKILAEIKTEKDLEKYINLREYLTNEFLALVQEVQLDNGIARLFIDNIESGVQMSQPFHLKEILSDLGLIEIKKGDRFYWKNYSIGRFSTAIFSMNPSKDYSDIIPGLDPECHPFFKKEIEELEP